MIKIIQFMSQAFAECLSPDPETDAIISITDICGRPAKLDAFKNIIRLEFMDADPGSEMEEFVFNRQQARDILNFVAALPESVEHIYIHCYAGISRSGAVAVALNEHLGLGDQEIAAYTMYNRHVYRTFMDEIHGMGSAFGEIE